MTHKDEMRARLRAEIEATIARNYINLYQRRYGEMPKGVNNHSIITWWNECRAMDNTDEEVLALMREESE